MTDSRSRSIEESRRIIREELADQHPRRGRRRLRQDADARRADGRRRRLGRLPGRAHGGRDVHAQGRLRAARPLPPRARDGCSAGRSWRRLRRRTSAARVHAALSNLERFFAGTIHSFCARLLRERPVESGVSPGFTELDEVQDLELRKRAWRDFIASARSRRRSGHAGAARGRRPPEGSRLRVRDHLPATRTSSSRRATASVRTRSRRGRRSRRSGRSCRSICRRASTPTRPARFRRRRAQFRGAAARVAQARWIGRPSSRRCSTRGTASRRSSRSGGPTRRPRRSASGT